MPTLAAFLNFVAATALLMAACYGLREFWVRALPGKVVAYLAAPGVALHELSHALACLLTGAKVHSITLFRADGSGEVKHSPSKLRYVGDVIIALAPLAGATLALWGLGVLLETPLNFYSVRAKEVTPDQIVFVAQLLSIVVDDIGLAFSSAVWSDWRTYVFLYLAFCITLAMAPSRQDLKNCTVGLLIVCGIALIVHLVVDVLLKARSDGPVFQFVARLLAYFHYPLAIAAISAILCAIVFVIGLPFRGRRRRR
ncbi:MAG: M50 family metallopeptidase [Planctomycetes bacterium]|nr:M50 family metallopeptidase [Planctomycetota bacterium]